MNAIELLAHDHRAIQGPLARWERSDPFDPERRRRLLQEIVRALVTHASVQERVLYPALLELPGGGELAREAARDHGKAEAALARLERMDPGDLGVNRGVEVVSRHLREHLRREQPRLLALLSKHMTERRLQQLGEEIERARRSAPTRPHPFVPRSPTMKKITDPLVSMVDKARDAVLEAVSTRPDGRHRMLGR